jgi:hypothetical protein
MEQESLYELIESLRYHFACIKKQNLNNPGYNEVFI